MVFAFFLLPRQWWSMLNLPLPFLLQPPVLPGCSSCINGGCYSYRSAIHCTHPYSTLFYFLSVHVVNLMRSFLIPYLSSMCTPSQLAAICKFNKQTLSWSLMKILNITRLRTDPCSNPAGVSLHFDSEPLVTTFWIPFSNRFCSHCIVHSSRPYFVSSPVGMSGEKGCQKAY